MATVAAGGTRSEREGMIACLVSDARALSPRGAIEAVLLGFKKNDLLTYASAISFQVFFALVPLTLLALGLLGTLGLSEWWSTDAAHTVKENVSAPVYNVINDTVRKILAHRQLFWVTLGAAIAIWEVSGAMRATMQVLNRVYGVEEKRSFRRKLWESIVLSTAVTFMLLLAAAVVKAGPDAARSLFGDGAAVSVLSVLASWGAAVALLFLVVAIVVRYAPATRRPVRWVTFGGVLVIAGWLVMSLLYGFYITQLADYASVFGGLAVVMVTMSYIYLSAIVFLSGAQLDSLIRHQVDVEGCWLARRGAPPAYDVGVELRQLEYFAAVARHRHFTRAADELYVTQSALSQQVRRLEEGLGLALLLRTSRGVELTPAGADLLARAESILAEVERARTDMDEHPRAPRGPGRGAATTGDALRLPRALATFHAEHPGIRIGLRQGSTADVVELVRKGAADLAVIGTLASDGPGLESEVVAEEALCVACAVDDPLAGAGEVSFEDLRG